MENKLRLRFSKADTLRYIGHLDFLRVFMQTIRRSCLPIAYSQGFNPHQIISFALPLPLGMESVHDYVDITLTKDLLYERICWSLNCVAPVGLHILDVYKAKGKPAASATTVADYLVDVGAASGTHTTDGSASLQMKISEILSAETLIIPKKTKSGVKNTDIRPDIFDIRVEDNALFLRLSAGSSRFLNPTLVTNLLYEGIGEKPCVSAMSRLELYRTGDNGEIVRL